MKIEVGRGKYRSLECLLYVLFSETYGKMRNKQGNKGGGGSRIRTHGQDNKSQ